MRITAAITTLLKHAPELGNSQLTKDGFLQMLLAMAQSDEYIEQLVASEALIAATAKKKVSRPKKPAAPKKRKRNAWAAFCKQHMNDKRVQAVPPRQRFAVLSKMYKKRTT